MKEAIPMTHTLIKEANKFKKGDYVYANGHREPRRWRDRGEHFYGTAPEMDRWEAERVQLVVMCVYESIDTPTVQVSRAQPDPITGNNYNFTYHPNELTLGVPPAIGHERRKP